MAACTSDEVAISGTGNLNVEFDNFLVATILF
jgi:hypothetical protein